MKPTVSVMLLAICLGISGAAPASSPGSAPFDYRWHVGLADGGYSDSIWIAIRDTTLAPGDSVTFLWNPEGADSGDAPSLDRGAIIERIRRPQEQITFSSMWDQETDGSPLTKGGFYRAASRDTADWHGLGFAFRMPIKVFRMTRGHLEVDLYRDGVNERFSECSSYEDVHLSVWTGAPYEGKERWRISYYVPYDLEPTCPGIPKNPEDLK